jgi:hypothetical protein
LVSAASSGAARLSVPQIRQPVSFDGKRYACWRARRAAGWLKPATETASESISALLTERAVFASSVFETLTVNSASRSATSSRVSGWEAAAALI